MDDITRSFVDQHLQKYDLQLKRIDVLLTQAQGKVRKPTVPAELNEQFERLQHERNKLAAWLDESKNKPLEHWKEDEIIKAGPMGIWDAVAQQLENLVERLGR